MNELVDFLLFIDMDVDDEFWYGIEVPVLLWIYLMGCGFKGFIESVFDFDYVCFIMLCGYLENYFLFGTVSIG